VDEVLRPPQAVLDREILQDVERVIRGIDFDNGPEGAVEWIKKGVEFGDFMIFPDKPDLQQGSSVRGQQGSTQISQSKT